MEKKSTLWPKLCQLLTHYSKKNLATSSAWLLPKTSLKITTNPCIVNVVNYWLNFIQCLNVWSVHLLSDIFGFSLCQLLAQTLFKKILLQYLFWMTATKDIIENNHNSMHRKCGLLLKFNSMHFLHVRS